MVGRKMNHTKISVVIPMYNAEETIEKAIKSVVTQTKSDIIGEILVIDDGSTDDSAQIINKLILDYESTNIKLIKQSNGGVSKARNVGIRLASFEWIALLDSDDVWFNNKIDYQWNILQKNDQIDFLGGNWRPGKFRILTRQITGLYKAKVMDICLKNFPQPSTAIFKKEIFKKIGGFDESQKYAEDGNYFLKICANYNFYFDPIQIIEYGSGKKGFGESGLSQNIKEMHKGNLKNIKEMEQFNFLNKFQYFFVFMFFQIKYIRRIIIKLVK